MRTQKQPLTLRVLLSAGLLASISLCLSATAHAAEPADTMLRLQPHCTEADRTKCPQFDVQDASTLKTNTMKAGDILDIDVVVTSPTPEKILAIRSWLTYDPAVLEVRNVELLPSLANPIPGENAADAQNKVIKIGGGTNNALKDKEVPIARITLTVKSDSTNTQIAFAQFKDDGTGLTGVLSNDEQAPSLLKGEPAKLTVIVQNAGTSASASSSMSQMSTASLPSGQMSSDISQESSMSTSSEMPAMNAGESTFPKLQVQNVRVTSSDTTLFVGWDPLPTPDLVGYNVYYGTISGRYIQRRTLNKDSNSLTIRGLESGVQYFIAVRGVDGSNLETAFSEEASVVIGRPETSTAPLFNGQNDGPTGNPVGQHGGQTVTGESGMGETMLFFVILSAFIGTAFASRRHFFSSHA